MNSTEFQSLMSQQFLMRHGRSIHNEYPEAWRLGRDSLLGLTVDGVFDTTAEVQRLAKQLKKIGPDVGIFRSPLLRAKQTALILIDALRNHDVRVVDHVERDELREFYYNETGKWPDHFDFNDYIRCPCTHQEVFVELRKAQVCVVDSMAQMVADATKLIEHRLYYWHLGPGPAPPSVFVSHHFKSNVIRMTAGLVAALCNEVPSPSLLSHNVNGYMVTDLVRDLFLMAGFKDNTVVRQLPELRGLLSHVREVARSYLIDPMENAELVPILPVDVARLSGLVEAIVECKFHLEPSRKHLLDALRQDTKVET